MEVSCRSPGSNSWEPFRPNSSQPRRKTDRLSYGRQQGTTDRQSLSLWRRGWFTGLRVTLGSVLLPAQRWGWAICWSSWPALVWLHSAACVEEGRSRDLLSLRGEFTCVVATSDIKNWVGVMSQAYSHNRMPFSNPLRKSLSPKLFPVTAWRRRTGRDRCKGGRRRLQLTIFYNFYYWLTSLIFWLTNSSFSSVRYNFPECEWCLKLRVLSNQLFRI